MPHHTFALISVKNFNIDSVYNINSIYLLIQRIIGLENSMCIHIHRSRKENKKCKDNCISFIL